MRQATELSITDIATNIIHRTDWPPSYDWADVLRPKRLHALAGGSLQLAGDGKIYPVDQFCCTQSDAPQALDYRSYPFDYLLTSITCGFRPYYPYGSYAFGLSRPTRFSYRNRFPPTDRIPDRSGFVYRSSLPTRNSLYTSPFDRPADAY